jgi:hypothetical protein
VLTGPYPTAVNGTPTLLAFDGTSRTLEFEYSTTRPAAGRVARVLTTVTIPAGILAATRRRSRGEGRRACAPSLVLLNLPHADHVTVHVTPAPCP